MKVWTRIPRPLPLLVALAAAAGLVTGALRPAQSGSLPPPGVAGSQSDGADTGQLVPFAGVGEQMLIVLGGDYASEAEAESAAAPFGEMQGFYVDASANYRVLGLYDQTGPDLRTIACDSPEAGVGAACTNGALSLKAYQPVALTYVPLSSAPNLLARSRPCGGLDLPPCVERRFRSVLTDQLQLVPSRYLLLSAFRTKAGAASFVELARTAGSTDVVVLRVLKTGGGYIGLGQEANPDGVSGPLLSPLPDPAKYQE